ncbi:hypothetical protein L198_01845 [Cryptococcus wingfieldii CBS 7118]|uniref:Uncharacterized protein n=1 Tax=Cryptococcus wingfieldii CBS 7118 TaxID=1295528 RepID=A0A1E3JY73_9TREE|nr:hypothetical protein L198_01845 [Cryptococcus wingfieldii CBS 7118]ODO05157.1 hypothetical protein L198_01845 [Cryptococcus wingfieldii CBS 7118]
MASAGNHTAHAHGPAPYARYPTPLVSITELPQSVCFYCTQCYQLKVLKQTGDGHDETPHHRQAIQMLNGAHNISLGDKQQSMGMRGEKSGGARLGDERPQGWIMSAPGHNAQVQQPVPSSVNQSRPSHQHPQYHLITSQSLVCHPCTAAIGETMVVQNHRDSVWRHQQWPLHVERERVFMERYGTWKRQHEVSGTMEQSGLGEIRLSRAAAGYGGDRRGSAPATAPLYPHSTTPNPEAFLARRSSLPVIPSPSRARHLTVPLTSTAVKSSPIPRDDLEAPSDVRRMDTLPRGASSQKRSLDQDAKRSSSSPFTKRLRMVSNTPTIAEEDVPGSAEAGRKDAASASQKLKKPEALQEKAEVGATGCDPLDDERCHLSSDSSDGGDEKGRDLGKKEDEKSNDETVSTKRDKEDKGVLNDELGKHFIGPYWQPPYTSYLSRISAK